MFNSAAKNIPYMFHKLLTHSSENIEAVFNNHRDAEPGTNWDSIVWSDESKTKLVGCYFTQYVWWKNGHHPNRTMPKGKFVT